MHVVQFIDSNRIRSVVMTDYFSEYSSFMGAAKGLPSPGDTPYETPGYIRSKRSSRATTGSSRAPSESPPPLPPDMTEVTEKSRDGRYGALDPHRFTPTLHASLVSEILNLRRELDSKIGLVESLETTVSQQRNENEGLNDRLSQNARETRKVKQQVQLIEKGTNDAVEDYAKERDIARANADDLRSKLENAQKTVRRQDEDAERTQRIWEAEKESWDSERRQLERRVHVTESRLRTVVDEMSAQQAVVEAQQLHLEEIDESLFKDSGLGNESDNGSIRSVTPVKHKRNRSSLSSRSRSVRYSTASRRTGTPEPQAKTGYSLADELGIDEEDEYDMDEFEHPDDELDHAEHLRRTIQSRNSSVSSELGSKAKRILGLTTENVDVPPSPTVRDLPKRSMDSATVSERSEPIKESLEQPTILPTLHEVISTPRLQYVDTGYQPSPPPSPLRDVRDSEAVSIPRIEEPVQQSTTDSGRESQSSQREVTARVVTPISLPDSPIIEDATTAEVGRASNGHPSYSTASTQTEFLDSEHHKNHTPKRDSLSPAVFVPAIAIHPPSSRPSSPRTYALPPGTKNASTQANIPWAYRDAFVQTEAIRVDKRLVKLPSHVPSGSLLPSPTFQQPLPPPSTKRAAIGGIAKIFTKIVPAQPTPSPPLQSPKETISETSRNTSEKNLRSMPLKVIPLPRPVLSPPLLQGETFSQGPLNRSASYGVSTNPGQRSSQLFELDKESDNSDNEDVISDFDTKDLEGSIPALYRPPAGRFALSKPPKVVPEDTEISPERRPGTAESYGAAPAPSIASSRANSVSKRAHNNPPTKLGAYNKGSKPRSPSFGSIASSNYSTQSVAPPFPIPTRSSSRVVPNSHSEGSQSPTPNHTDVFGNRAGPSRRTQHGRQPSLRKVQSAAVIRHPARRVSPQKSRRRRRHSPDLTPVQSMAFESPAPTNFPIPELPTPMYDNTSATFDLVKGSMDVGRRSDAAASSVPRASDVETNLVDAIAGTMVGEWMWKYVRKRKSFGVQEDFPVAADGSVDTSVSGSRHKRWVWLSPYERTIMWDSKQPATGTALLGKKGRKCEYIQFLTTNGSN